MAHRIKQGIVFLIAMLICGGGVWAATGCRTLIIQPEDGKTAILTAIGHAESSITLTIYNSTNIVVDFICGRTGQ